jgi:hypothetical protein
VAVLTNWAQIQQLQGQDSSVQAGAGLYVYSAGVIALVVGTIRTFITKPAS